MSKEVLEVRTVNGVEVTKFHATPAMRLFALSSFFDPELRGKSPDKICKAIGISNARYREWLGYEPWFSEWLEELRASLGGANRRAALEFVGMQQAMNGEFNFWKAMALKEGVISPDRLDVGAAIPANLGAMKDASQSDLDALQNSILAGLRSQGEPGEVALVEGPDGWERESDQSGTAEVPGSVVSVDELGSY